MKKIFTRGLSVVMVCVLFLPVSSFAQKMESQVFSKELAIISDNDFYLLSKKDGYYTNGLIFKLSTVGKNTNSKTLKNINHFEIGQLLFNQGNRKIQSVALIDRPITGYLYGKFTKSIFTAENKLYELGASVGTIGEAALGKNMQNFFHRQINVNSNHWGWIWDYQLHNEVGLNLHGTYAISLMKKEKSLVQVTPQVQATAGTSFTNITPGVAFQFGKFNNMSESSYWRSSIKSRQASTGTAAEYFIFYHPRLMYQAYNATVQGGLFRDDKGPITSSIEPFVFLQEAGFMLSKSRYAFAYTVTLQTREAASQKSNHAYGTVQLSYRLR